MQTKVPKHATIEQYRQLQQQIRLSKEISRIVLLLKNNRQQLMWFIGISIALIGLFLKG